jgi:hypothetical protein
MEEVPCGQCNHIECSGFVRWIGGGEGFACARVGGWGWVGPGSRGALGFARVRVDGGWCCWDGYPETIHSSLIEHVIYDVTLGAGESMIR